MRTKTGFAFLTVAGTFLLLILMGAGQAAAGAIYCVDASALTTGNGHCWATPFKDLQSALAVAVSGDTIRVAKGTYKPTTGTDRTISFNLKPDITLEGGYPSGGGTRNPANKTILSGDIGIAEYKPDNSYHVVKAILWTKDAAGNLVQYPARLDGFTITGGNANLQDGSDNDRGGGMYIEGGTPTLENITFSDNSAFLGGGLFGESGNQTLINVTFSGNEADQQGEGGGGGARFWGSEATLTNVTFSGNKAGYDGGGLWVDDKAKLTMKFATFSGNTAGIHGGGFHAEGENDPHYIYMNNTIFWGNDPDQLNPDKNHVEVNNSVIQGGCPSGGPGYISCTNIITGDPLLGELGDNGGWTPTISLNPGSSAIDAGSADPDVTTDQRGVARPQPEGGARDIGAFEYVPPPQGDTTPPVITSLTASPNILWPANGKPVSVIVTVMATDNRSVVSATVAIFDEYCEYNSQPISMSPTTVNGVFTAKLSLIARRNGNDLNGRTYTLTVKVADAAGNVSIPKSVVVLVPHDMGKK